MKKEVLRRITIGWGKYWQLKNILKNDKVSDNLKNRCLESCVCTHPFYMDFKLGPLLKNYEERLNTTQRKM